jgi:hypothetical protein
MRKNFISAVSLFVISIILPIISQCQNATNFEEYLEGLSSSVTSEERTAQKYLLTTDYMDYDIYGNFNKKFRVAGDCTFMKDGNKKWNNIITAKSQDLEESYTEGEKHHYMENFTYNPSSDILSESFFESVPQADIYMKNLVWDMTAFEVFAWFMWDSLQLNSTFSAKEINSKIDIPGAGTFENKDIQITWTGITKINNEICRIVKFNVMNNPMEIGHQNVTMKGRSHYWGNIYVAISDKQIEYGELYEDVILDIKMQGQETGSLASTVRYITLQKSSK